jgi:predicted ribosomally synthesized peptide with nif11-like leader
MAQQDLDRFRELVLEDPALQEQLRQREDVAQFRALVLQLGQERGFDFTEDDVAAAMRAEGMPGWNEGSNDGNYIATITIGMAAKFAGWIPIRAYWRGNRPVVDWGHFGNLRFTDPFFADTVAKALRRPFNQLFRRQTSVETLCELEACDPGLPPTGFIFHMSRCGSTLTAQMLAALPQNIVIAEAAPIDSILSANLHSPLITDTQRILWLRAMVSALGRGRQNREKHFFIKFDSWHTLDLPLIQQVFPEVPWIFLYREPLEVMVSHQNMPGSQMVPGMLSSRFEKLPAGISSQMSLAEYSAGILEVICEAALRHRDDRGLFINYQQLAEAVEPLLEGHFGVPLSDAEKKQMLRVTEFDAKTPCLPFVPDSEQKKRQASETIHALSTRFLTPVYERLEALRWSGGLQPVERIETKESQIAVD